jgi:prephenate dehydrogenase
MVASFLTANRTEVKEAVADFRASLEELEGALDAEDAELASILMEAARDLRRRTGP